MLWGFKSDNVCESISASSKKHGIIIICDYQFEKLAFVLRKSVLPKTSLLALEASLELLWATGIAGIGMLGTCELACLNHILVLSSVSSEYLNVQTGDCPVRVRKEAQKVNRKEQYVLGVEG